MSNLNFCPICMFITITSLSTLVDRIKKMFLRFVLGEYTMSCNGLLFNEYVPRYDDAIIAILCRFQVHGPLARCVKLRVAHAPGMPGTRSPPPRVSDTDMHHGTCVTHVPWCMPEPLTRFPLKSVAGKMFPAIPTHAQLTILRLWWKVHESDKSLLLEPTIFNESKPVRFARCFNFFKTKVYDV